MTFYPFHKDLHDFADKENFSSGNFGLWYNKLIPNIGSIGNDAWSVCDNKGDKNGRTEFYKNIYQNIKKNNNLTELLVRKQCWQMHYTQCMEQHGFHCFAFTGTLKTALITGLGEAHPSETSIVLDHTLGIPYFPASGIKGMVRFSHSKQLVLDEAGNFLDTFVKEIKRENNSSELILDEKNIGTHIPLFFGGDLEKRDGKSQDTYRGSIIFLDAYPVSVPEIKTDIINPHYSNYYDDKNEPPGDYQDPVPVKFLTIAPETQFIFRFILDPESTRHKDQFLKAIKDALENEGIGAKTAIGYGRFKISQYTPDKLIKSFKEYLKSTLTEKEQQELDINDFIKRINKVEKADNSETAKSNIDSLFNEWRNPDNNAFMNNNHMIAKAFETKVKKKKSKGGFTKQYQIICEILKKLPEDKLEPETSPQSDKRHKSDSDPEVVKKLEKIINRGFCLRREKNKILRKYKKSYLELCSTIKRLPQKKK